MGLNQTTALLGRTWWRITVGLVAGWLTAAAVAGVVGNAIDGRWLLVPAPALWAVVFGVTTWNAFGVAPAWALRLRLWCACVAVVVLVFVLLVWAL